MYKLGAVIAALILGESQNCVVLYLYCFLYMYEFGAFVNRLHIWPLYMYELGAISGLISGATVTCTHILSSLALINCSAPQFPFRLSRTALAQQYVRR